MERSIHVRLPDVLANNMDRFTAKQGMTDSELVRQALRQFFAAGVRESAASIASVTRTPLEREGVTEATADSYYRKERKNAKRQALKTTV